MNKSSELVVTSSGIVAEETGNNGHGIENKSETSYVLESYRPTNFRINCGNVNHCDSLRNNEENEEKKDIPKFTMIFNKYNNKLNLRPSAKQDDSKSKDKNGIKYMMIFNKDVTIRSKSDSSPSLSKSGTSKGDENSESAIPLGNSKSAAALDTSPLQAIEPALSSVKLNDAETLMTLYGRSNLFIPELTMCSMVADNDDTSRKKKNEKQEKPAANDPSLRLHNSLTSLSKNKPCRRQDNSLKNKIASLTSLETHLAREVPRKHISAMQDRKVFRVRSLDLSESVSSSDSDLERSLSFQRSDEKSSKGKRDTMLESPKKSDKKSRGDAIRKGEKENGCHKQVQWKSEVDVIYFESHQTADGDRSGEILARVMEPLREEWEQQRTGFYAKIVPLPLGSHLNERWQSLLKI